MKKTILMGVMGLVVIFSAQAACNLANGTELTVSITAPSAGEKLVMGGKDEDFKKSDDTALTAVTAASSGGTDSSLTWTFSSGTFPSGNTGTSVALKTLSAWPSDNSKFGDQNILLGYTGGIGSPPSDCTNTVAVKVFFEPSVNVEGSTPAWFKYWSDGPLTELSSFIFCETTPSSSTAWGEYVCTYNPFIRSFLKFDPMPYGEGLYIARKAYASSVTTPKLSISLSGKPIKIVTCVVEHELDHQARRKASCQAVKNLYDTWWAGLGFTTKTYYFAHPNEVSSKLLEFWAAVDEDQDAVLNANDPTNSTGNDYDDECAAERKMVGALYDKEKDWSKGGEKW